MAARISEIFLYIKNPESDLFFFFQKNPSLKKNCFLFQVGVGKRELASVSEFVLHRIQM